MRPAVTEVIRLQADVETRVLLANLKARCALRGSLTHVTAVKVQMKVCGAFCCRRWQMPKRQPPRGRGRAVTRAKGARRQKALLGLGPRRRRRAARLGKKTPK